MPSWKLSTRHPALLPAGVALVILVVAPLSAQGLAGPVQAEPAFSVRQASAPPELSVTFEVAAVVAAGLTSGGDAVFWSVAREPRGYYQQIVRRQGLAVVDALGEARFEPESGAVPLKSVWAVVDIPSGAFAVTAPPGFPLEEVPFPGKGFEAGAPGLVNRFRHELESVDLLLVRPGVGAWVLRAFDQAPEDHDETDDDRVLTSLEDFVPLQAGGPDPPERYAADDVLVVVHPRDLRVYATRLLGAPTPEGGAE